MATATISFLDYSVRWTVGRVPMSHARLAARARLCDAFPFGEEETPLALSVARGGNVELAVELSFSPGSDSGFLPELHVVPDTETLFLGAGTTVLVYDLKGARQLSRYDLKVGFWGWERHADVILMLAELELAAWSLRGEMTWSTFVEPPWSCRVMDGRLQLDVMGKLSQFDLASGPPR